MSKSDPIVYGVAITSNTGSLVTGVFKFDGRLKAGQGADFTYVIDPAWVNPQKPDWHVLVNRSRNGVDSVIRRSMKECYQKDAITVQLQTLLDDTLADSGADTVTPSAEPAEGVETAFGRKRKIIPTVYPDDLKEYGVETERELSATVPTRHRYEENDNLNAYARTEAKKEIKIAAQKFERWQAKRRQSAATTQATTEDLLEIPDFLKRTS